DLPDCPIARLPPIPGEDAVGEGDVEGQGRGRVGLEVGLTEGAQGGEQARRRHAGDCRLQLAAPLGRDAVFGLEAALHHEKGAQLIDELALELTQVEAVVADGGDEREAAAEVAVEGMTREGGGALVADETEAGAYVLDREVGAVGSRELVEEVLGVAQAA